MEKESAEAGDCRTSVSRDSLAAAASWRAKSGSAGGAALSVTMTLMPGGRPPSPAAPADELALRLLGDPNEVLRPKDGRRSRLRSRSFWSLLRASRVSRVSDEDAAVLAEAEVEVLKKEDEKKGAAFWAGVAPLRCIMTVCEWTNGTW